MTIRRGLVNPTPAAAPSPTGRASDVKPHTVIGRQLTPRAPEPPPQPQARIIATPEEARRPVLREPIVRGLLTDASGKPLRGLSQATMQAYKAQTEDCTELCTRCGEMRPPAEMKTVVPNAENPNNPVRICINECVPPTYKNPYNDREKWQPFVPGVRFDRERGQPYNAREAGVTIADLVNRDTYHKENEVDPQFRVNGVVGEGHWSGGGRVGHAPTSRR